MKLPERTVGHLATRGAEDMLEHLERHVGAHPRRYGGYEIGESQREELEQCLTLGLAAVLAEIEVQGEM